MRVLHVFNEINFSGAEVMYANAAPLFQEKGIELIALSTGKEFGNFTQQFETVHIKMHHKPLLESDKNPLFLFKYFRSIIKFIREENIAVIHIHRSSFFWLFSLCGFITGRKTIRTLHNVFKNRRITWIKAYWERLTARTLLRVTFQSIGKSVYLNELQYYKNKSVIVNNWFDKTRFYPAVNEAEKASVRKILNIPADVFVVSTAGRCTEIKGHKDIIQALAIINKQFPCVFLHLGSGALEKEEQELAKELGLDGVIRFLGNVTNVRDFIIASDAFVMSSKFEGLSIASIEAMACRIPGIFYDSPGLRDLINSDDNGFLVAHGARALADAILLFCNDRNLCEVKGQSAVTFVNEHFSIENGVKGILNLYGKTV
ncbi:glycosyltransferase involved in cell wall biosynthesis [Filimonas zeae]|uniref:Glycosyl transferase n=1 Tax=Filimonas zeae TaxID=1737353 RepID=A0A917IKN1_9BACT|nr:glycosyltransferase [Filimonas zeae]MDR6336998.1 glycosyltransferase involved in cell wall biosynthesis [Filimonas zeae]GGH56517.1 glycosyl transferase [Filimonas zeae]